MEESVRGRWQTRRLLLSVVALLLSSKLVFCLVSLFVFLSSFCKNTFFFVLLLFYSRCILFNVDAEYFVAEHGTED